jgi:hypothetical protein
MKVVRYEGSGGSLRNLSWEREVGRPTQSLHGSRFYANELILWAITAANCRHTSPETLMVSPQ